MQRVLCMENEKGNPIPADADKEDIVLDFANSFSRRQKQTGDAQTDPDFFEPTLQVNSRSDVEEAVFADAFEAPVHIEEENFSVDEAYEYTYEPEEQAVEEEKPLSPRRQRRAEKRAIKQAKRDKKEAKRNAKIDRQQKNNTKVMLGGAVFLCIICAFLLFMNHYELSFFDLPDVLSGEKKLSAENTTKALVVTDPTVPVRSDPPKGIYIVSSADGVYLRETASTDANRLAVLSEGTQVSISAFKYDSENEVFWGRANYDGTYGWVIMTTMTLKPNETELSQASATTSDSLG